ncbi:PREDICTED: ras-related protein Rab-21 [Nipponia nippon]|nr:PREDICTED: ras-related protein Rab-21 [Nipponia nippon]
MHLPPVTQESLNLLGPASSLCLGALISIVSGNLNPNPILPPPSTQPERRCSCNSVRMDRGTEAGATPVLVMFINCLSEALACCSRGDAWQTRLLHVEALSRHLNANPYACVNLARVRTSTAALLLDKASFLTKKLNIGGKRVNLAIWDTAGQERFHALGPIYYRDSNGAILVYDITDEDSFQKVKNWVKELRKMLGNEICLCIVGNKIDLEKERHVSVQEAETYAESVGAKHYHTSAKQNKGIEELFLDLCKRMIETAQVDERARGNGSSQSGIARRGVQIIDDEPQVQSSGGCCSSG